MTTAHVCGLRPRSIGVRVTGTVSFNVESIPCPEVSVTCKHRCAMPLGTSAAPRPPGWWWLVPPRRELVSPRLGSDFQSGQSSGTATSPGPLPSCGHVGCWFLEELRAQSGTQTRAPGGNVLESRQDGSQLCVGQAGAHICAGHLLAEWFQAGASALWVSSGSSGHL